MLTGFSLLLYSLRAMVIGNTEEKNLLLSELFFCFSDKLHCRVSEQQCCFPHASFHTLGSCLNSGFLFQRENKKVVAPQFGRVVTAQASKLTGTYNQLGQTVIP